MIEIVWHSNQNICLQLKQSPWPRGDQKKRGHFEIADDCKYFLPFSCLANLTTGWPTKKKFKYRNCKKDVIKEKVVSFLNRLAGWQQIWGVDPVSSCSLLNLASAAVLSCGSAAYSPNQYHYKFHILILTFSNFSQIKHSKFPIIGKGCTVFSLLLWFTIYNMIGNLYLHLKIRTSLFSSESASVQNLNLKFTIWGKILCETIILSINTIYNFTRSEVAIFIFTFNFNSKLPSLNLPFTLWNWHFAWDSTIVGSRKPIHDFFIANLYFLIKSFWLWPCLLYSLNDHQFTILDLEISHLQLSICDT